MKYIVVRKMPDGLTEIQDERGRRRRCRFISCVECEQVLPDFVFGLNQPFGHQYDGPPVCSSCQQSSIEREHLEKKAAKRNTFGPGLKSNERRYLALVQATPKWRDKEKIKAIYDECREMTQKTGTLHHVDHFYPIQGDLSCGLHVHHNLQIITAAKNWSKKAKHPLEDSPALWM